MTGTALRKTATFTVAALAYCVFSIAPVQAELKTDSSMIESRVEKLLAQMTIEEKLGQLTQQSGGHSQGFNPGDTTPEQKALFDRVRSGEIGSFLNTHGAVYINEVQRIATEESRLGIPVIFGNDVIHGYRTTFPIPLAESASWSPIMAEKSARVAAIEAYAAGINWTFAPMIDIARDPRWGRIAEGAGEDPYLGAKFAVARVKGFQGGNLADAGTIAACAKHYVAYGAAEGGRDYNTVDISLRTLREIHMPPFEAAVEAGVATLMSAFNEINGIPASANRFTLTDVLRGEWGFKGFVVSDWTSVKELIRHGYAADEADAGEKAIYAGVDMEMASTCYRDHLANAVKEGRISQEVIDEAVRRVLRVKFQLGLFDNPYRDVKKEKELVFCQEHRNIARDVARHSIVLLKNEGNLLPLSDKLSSLAIVGPLADTPRDALGMWSPTSRNEDAVTILAGIKKRLSEKTKVTYVKGCEVQGGSTDGFAEAVQAAKNSEVTVVVVGESEGMNGEARCRSSLDIPEIQRELLKTLHATGKPIIVLLMTGRPLSINWTAENIPAILNVWHLGTEMGLATADVLFGDFNPGGKLPATFPRTVGQIPIHYNHKNTGRPPVEGDFFRSRYLDLPSSPLYPFGFGLSYTTFEFGNLKLSSETIRPADTLIVTVNVKNTGKRKGDEVAQLYIRDLVASVTRPVRELKGFERITLDPGETKTVTFKLSPKELGFYNQQMKFAVEPGKFKIWVGPNSVEGVEGSFEVTDNQH